LYTIRYSLRDLASHDDEEDAEDKVDDEDVCEVSKLSADDEPGLVMGTISQMVMQSKESFWQHQMKLDGLMQPGWGDMAEYFHERDKKYGTAKSMVPAVDKAQQ